MWPNPLSVPFSLLSRISYVTLQVTFLSRGIKTTHSKGLFLSFQTGFWFRDEKLHEGFSWAASGSSGCVCRRVWGGIPLARVP